MNLAEQLKQEIDVHKEMPWLKDSVISHIRNSGEYCIICDTHIYNIRKDFAIPYRYWKPIEDWARKEGFNVYCSCNSYGVKHLFISL